MALIVLDRVWVNLMSTGEAVSAFSMPERPRQHAMDGEVKTYAGGRRRSITTEGLEEQFGCVLRELSKATVDTLISWIGQYVQVRDNRGQQFFGVFFSVTPIEKTEPTLWDASIVVRVTSGDGGV